MATDLIQSSQSSCCGDDCCYKYELQGCAAGVPYVQVVVIGVGATPVVKWINLNTGDVVDTKPTSFISGACSDAISSIKTCYKFGSDEYTVYVVNNVTTIFKNDVLLSSTTDINAALTVLATATYSNVVCCPDCATNSKVCYEIGSDAYTVFTVNGTTTYYKNGVLLSTSGDIAAAKAAIETATYSNVVDCTQQLLDGKVCYEFGSDKYTVITVNGVVTYYKNSVLLTNAGDILAAKTVVDSATYLNVVDCTVPEDTQTCYFRTTSNVTSTVLSGFTSNAALNGSGTYQETVHNITYTTGAETDGQYSMRNDSTYGNPGSPGAYYIAYNLIGAAAPYKIYSQKIVGTAGAQSRAFFHARDRNTLNLGRFSYRVLDGSTVLSTGDTGTLTMTMQKFSSGYFTMPSSGFVTLEIYNENLVSGQGNDPSLDDIGVETTTSSSDFYRKVVSNGVTTWYDDNGVVVSPAPNVTGFSIGTCPTEICYTKSNYTTTQTVLTGFTSGSCVNGSGTYQETVHNVTCVSAPETDGQYAMRSDSTFNHSGSPGSFYIAYNLSSSGAPYKIYSQKLVGTAGAQSRAFFWATDRNSLNPAKFSFKVLDGTTVLATGQTGTMGTSYQQFFSGSFTMPSSGQVTLEIWNENLVSGQGNDPALDDIGIEQTTGSNLCYRKVIATNTWYDGSGNILSSAPDLTGFVETSCATSCGSGSSSGGGSSTTCNCTASDFISTDANNQIYPGSDGKLFVQSIKMETQTFTATAGQTAFSLLYAPLGDVRFSRNGATIADAAATEGQTVTYVPANNNNQPMLAGDRVDISYIYAA